MRRRVQKKKHYTGIVILLFSFTLIVIWGAFNLFSVEQQAAPISNFAELETEPNRDDEITWCLILVNKSNHIPNDYEIELTELSNGQSVDKRIYPSLQEMFDSARIDGVYPIVVDGYRTAEKQQSLMDEKVADYISEGYSDEEALTEAKTLVAVPGASEHQLGIAIDINADGINSAGYEVYEWLGENAYKYGFICRYPSDKTEITGINYEPWHYRYVGVGAATEIYNQSICLEEYLSRIN